MSNKDVQQDPRCPRTLADTPTEWCPLAVMRLRAIRTAGRELTEEEESLLPGCPWAVNHQLANYCFFKYIQEYAGEKPLSDVEIASLNCISTDTVKRVEKSGLSKIRNTEEFQSLKESLNGESAISEQHTDDDYKIYR